MGWPQLVLIGLSLAWGVGSAVIPVLNAEAYVIAQQAAPDATPLTIVLAAVAVGVGQTIGKVILFLAARRGTELAIIRRRNARKAARKAQKAAELSAENTSGEAADVPVAPWRRRFARLRTTLAVGTRRMLALVGSPRWGIPIVALAAFVGLPPIYAVALVAGASKMRLPVFAITVLIGRIGRFVLIAEGAHLGLHKLVG